MDSTINGVKTLRQHTGAGIMDCKRALEESSGDVQAAEAILYKQGLAKAAKKAGRETREGVVHAYIHPGNRIGALVEVNCETDFVARTPEFQELIHQLAMQVAAMSPVYLDASLVPEGVSESPTEICLLQQPFIKDPSKTIQDLIQETMARLAENIQVRRFCRFALGE